jgi:hypothetical protein
MAIPGKRILLATGIALTIAGCGGGGGGSDSSGTRSDGSTDVTSGSISAFGSIVVNGRRLAVAGPNISIEQDGDDRAEGNLALGMMVRVSDDDDRRRVEIDEAVRGPVDAIDVDGQRLTVVGQTVRTDAATVFDGADSRLDALSVGNVVEVYGLRDDADAIRASHIDREDDDDDYSVTGIVTNHDPGALTFEIGGLTVDYQNAEREDLPGGNWNGLLVEVEDEARTYNAGVAELVATEVEREERAGARPGQRIEIERIVTAVNGDGTFRVSGNLLVRAGEATYRIGTAADLTVGARVEIEGILISDGTLRATKIKFDDNDARVSGPIDSINLAGNEITILGVTVTFDGDTEFDDVSGPGGLAENDFVEVEGRITPDGRVIAHEIEREDDDDDRELRGVVTTIDAGAGTLEILGVTVLIGGATELEDDDDERLNRSEFFSRIVRNATIVEAEWEGDTFASTATTPASSVEIEDDDDHDDFDDDDDDDDDDRDDDD